MFASIGARLREERERLGYNQTDFGKLAGVTLQSQGNYESGRRDPSASYLAAIAAAGVDVQYILTGERYPSSQTLSPEETTLVDNYRLANGLQKEAIRLVARCNPESHVK